MPSTATYEDVNLILRLYDMRREDKLRKARAWFIASFKGVDNMERFLEVCPPGTDQNAYFRMITTYWDMVASFITAGVLNADLFFQSGREMLFVWERIRDLVEPSRAAFKDPTALANLEAVAKRYIEHLNSRDPELYPAFSARARS